MVEEVYHFVHTCSPRPTALRVVSLVEENIIMSHSYSPKRGPMGAVPVRVSWGRQWGPTGDVFFFFFTAGNLLDNITMSFKQFFL